jgi:serine/threonine-protein kinase
MTGICGFSRAGRVALAGIVCGALLVIAPAARAVVYGAQETLRFSGLSDPNGVAVDAAGDVFVGDFGNNRVVELPAGASTQVVLPSSGLDGPTDIAVDAAGDLFATEPSNSGTELVVELSAGASSWKTLPFDVKFPEGIAVDGKGDVYVADGGNNAVTVGNPGNPQVVELPAGSSTQVALPTDVLGQPTEPMGDPVGLALDPSGDLFTIDASLLGDRVLELSPGSVRWEEIPSTGLAKSGLDHLAQRPHGRRRQRVHRR